MIKNLKIISLFFFTFYIQASENNFTIPICSSALQLEKYIQSLPIKNQQPQRLLYLQNQEILCRFTSYYRDLAYEYIKMEHDNSSRNFFLTIEFPEKLMKIKDYDYFKILLDFEIEYQEKIMDFVFEYNMNGYSKENFIIDFTKNFKINRSEKRFQKELAKAFLYIENKAIQLKTPAEISYFFDLNSSNQKLATLTWLSAFANKNKGLE